jgi:YD repeat-containing protein
MKRLISAVLGGLLLATPAFAGYKVEFKRDSGETNVVTFDGAGSATLATGQTVPYTYDEATLTLCISAPDRQRCLTFAEANPEPKAGDVTRYTSDDSAEGSATILEITP